ncbi:hypothetical protein H6785_01820 [Candidatus Nomurabacteria bacterium]|nr:hypothetical protein [Candidatus Nomurabacteria bacterium]
MEGVTDTLKKVAVGAGLLASVVDWGNNGPPLQRAWQEANQTTTRNLAIIWKGLFQAILVLVLAFVLTCLKVYTGQDWTIWLSFGVAILSTTLVIMTFLGSRLVLGTAVLGTLSGWLQDKDKSISVWGAEVKLFTLVMTLAGLFLAPQYFLVAWPFENNLGAFWLVFLGAILLSFLTLTIPSKLIKGLAWVFIPTTMIAALWSTLPGTYTGVMFNKNGVAKYMQEPSEFDQNSLPVVYVQYTPKTCRPEDKKHFMKAVNEKGEEVNGMFPYATEGTCASPRSGVKLIPVTRATALAYQPWSRIQAFFGGFKTTIESLDEVLKVAEEQPQRPSYDYNSPAIMPDQPVAASLKPARAEPVAQQCPGPDSIQLEICNGDQVWSDPVVVQVGCGVIGVYNLDLVRYQGLVNGEWIEFTTPTSTKGKKISALKWCARNSFVAEREMPLLRKVI